MNKLKQFLKECAKVLVTAIAVAAGLIVCAGLGSLNDTSNQNAEALPENARVIDYFEYNQSLFQEQKQNLLACVKNLHSCAPSPQTSAVNEEYLADSLQMALFCVQRYLSESELLGTALYIEHIGRDSFWQSSYLNALNDEQTPTDCAIAMAAYPADTLLSEQDIKLRWLCSAVLLKRITPYQFAHLPLKQLPQISLAEFYEKEPSVIDNMYLPCFKEETLRKVTSLK